MRLGPFIAVILLVIAILCSPLLLRSDRYRTRLAEHLSQRLQHKVLIGRLDGGLFPPALKLRSVSMLAPAGDAPLLQVDQLVAPVSLGALFRGSVVPSSLRFRGWIAYVRRNPDRTWPWEEWIGPAGGMSGETGWPLKSITFDRGECHAVDAYGPGPEEFIIQVLQGGWESKRGYASIHGVFTTLPEPVNFLFQGSGRFLSNPEWSAVLEMTEGNRKLKLDWKVAQGHTESAQGRAEEWRFDTLYAFVRYFSRLPVPPPVAAPETLLQDWTSQFDWKADTLNFKQSAALAGGRAEAAGKLTLAGAQVDLAIQGAKLHLIEAALWGKMPLEGTATGMARLELELSSAPWSSINGTGAFEVKEGKYYWPEASAKSLSKAHTMRYLQKKFPGFLQTGMTFSKASVKWQMLKGVASIDDAFVQLGNIQMAMAGTYDAARRGLDAYTRVQIQENDPKLLQELPPTYLHKEGGDSRLQPMHGRIQGTPNEWQLRAFPASKIPAGLRNKLSKSIRGK